jgi:hypothetical protein
VCNFLILAVHNLHNVLQKKMLIHCTITRHTVWHHIAVHVHSLLPFLHSGPFPLSKTSQHISPMMVLSSNLISNLYVASLNLSHTRGTLEVKQPEQEADIYLVPRSRLSGTIQLLHLYGLTVQGLYLLPIVPKPTGSATSKLTDLLGKHQ